MSEIETLTSEMRATKICRMKKENFSTKKRKNSTIFLILISDYLIRLFWKVTLLTKRTLFLGLGTATNDFSNNNIVHICRTNIINKITHKIRKEDVNLSTHWYISNSCRCSFSLEIFFVSWMQIIKNDYLTWINSFFFCGTIFQDFNLNIFPQVQIC